MAFVTPVVEYWLEREIAQWVHDEGSIRTCTEIYLYHRYWIVVWMCSLLNNISDRNLKPSVLYQNITASKGIG